MNKLTGPLLPATQLVDGMETFCNAQNSSIQQSCPASVPDIDVGEKPAYNYLSLKLCLLNTKSCVFKNKSLGLPWWRSG